MNVLAHPPGLKLIALDREGLDILSAHLQDSCANASDIAWLPKKGQFAMKLMRFDWAGAKLGLDERVGAVLRFDRVLSVAKLGDFTPGRPMSLIAAQFEQVDPPSGFIILAFSDGGILRLEVECVEAELRDIGPRAPATQCAGHHITQPEAV